MLVFHVLTGYLLGSVPFGRIIGFLVSGFDITTRGSGNIGATNVGREVGTFWGIATLILDAAKGFLPVVLFLKHGPAPEWLIAAALLAPVLGHQFSVFSRFKGGKGVATALGVWMAASPLAAMMAVFPFAMCVALWRYVSLGSMAASLLLPLFIFIAGEGTPYIAAGIITSGLILYRHRENMKRIFAGEEPRWGWRRHDKS